MNTTDANHEKEVALSIIVPVYNKESYIEACVESLAKQNVLRKATGERFEAIFVDDGSDDGSLEFCQALAEECSFMKVIHKENGGVSSARNAGIDAAQGRYLLFLDADDTISPNTVAGLIETFDSLGQSTDVVSYPLFYVTPQTGSRKGHEREKYFTRTGVYHLDDIPHVAQSTMNVCVRNRFGDNIHFDESIKMGEDQLYITANLARTKTIGSCKDARYYYTRDGTAASFSGNNPLYSYEDMVKLFSYLIKLAESDSEMARYAYSLILYNVSWRIKSNTLYPNHLTGEDREIAEAKLTSVLSSIPFNAYVESPYLNAHHRTFLMHRYSIGEGINRVSHLSTKSIMLFNDGSITKTALPKIIFERCYLQDHTLSIRCRLSAPSFIFENEPELFFETESICTKVPLTESSYSYSLAKFKTTVCRSFSTSFHIPQGESLIVKPRLVIDGTPAQHVVIDLSPRLHNAYFLTDIMFFEGGSLRARGGKLIVNAFITDAERKRLRKDRREQKNCLQRRVAMQAYIATHGPKKTWLYSDLPEALGRGNALEQILHDLRYSDGIKRYYVTEHERAVTKAHPQLAGHIVQPRSKKHAMLSLRSEIVLASYAERSTFLPMTQKSYNQVGDLSCKQVRIYLQHGILHAHLPWYYSFDRLLFDKEVISTTLEQTTLKSKYGFRDDSLLLTGAPRFDQLPYNATDKKKVILYAPSWRNYLLLGKAGNRIAADNALLSSSFFKGAMEFIRLIKENGLLEQEGYTMEIKLHPHFECYKHFFEPDNSTISLANDEIDEGQYDIFITDYSSYVYDFVYSGSKIIYFLPDHIEFNAGLNHYSELELPFERGFGPYCTTADSAFEAVARAMRNDDSLSVYDKRKEGFFLHTDGNNRARLYKECMRLSEQLRQHDHRIAESAIV